GCVVVVGVGGGDDAGQGGADPARHVVGRRQSTPWRARSGRGRSAAACGRGESLRLGGGAGGDPRRVPWGPDGHGPGRVQGSRHLLSPTLQLARLVTLAFSWVESPAWLCGDLVMCDATAGRSLFRSHRLLLLT